MRSTAAWASAIGLADISNVGLLYRLRNCGDLQAGMVGWALGDAALEAASGRLIRLIDATPVPQVGVPQAGLATRQKNGLWRVHSAFELPAERFGFFELTNEQEGERFDRIPVVKGEIRIADRAYMQPRRIASVLAAGGDILVRPTGQARGLKAHGWKGAAWLNAEGNPSDLIAKSRNAQHDLNDRPIWVRCRGAGPLRLRLVALRKSPTAAEAARRKARPPRRKRADTRSPRKPSMWPIG